MLTNRWRLGWNVRSGKAVVRFLAGRILKVRLTKEV